MMYFLFTKINYIYFHVLILSIENFLYKQKIILTDIKRSKVVQNNYKKNKINEELEKKINMIVKFYIYIYKPLTNDLIAFSK